MALARTLGVALSGVAGQLVEIEADIAGGIPGLSFTGLADTSVMESRDRIRAAMVNSGVGWPNRKITVALLPADVPKVGSRFDLAMALVILAAAGEVRADAVADAVWIAELGLDGRLRPVRGVLPSVVTAQREGVRRVVVAPANAAEAALVHGLDVRAAHDLREVLQWLRGEAPAPMAATADSSDDFAGESPDLADVAGQAAAKRALEVAAAGGHHLYLLGAPGAGNPIRELGRTRARYGPSSRSPRLCHQDDRGGMAIRVRQVDRAIHVEDVEGDDVALLDLIPLADWDDPDEAVAALSADWGVETPAPAPQ